MKTGRQNILRSLRIVVSVVIFALLTAMLASYGIKTARFAGVLARIQFVPAAFALSLTYLVGWLIITLIFGRIYCSSVCPIGTFQDILARLPRIGRHNGKKDYHYSPALTSLRNTSLFIVMASVLLGISLLITLIDPYSVYSRFAVYCLKPLWGLCVNAFSSTPVKLAAASVVGASVALLTIAVIGWLAWRNGRTFCNTICPVGTTLGFISRNAVFHIDINTDKCTQCRACEHVCKASCIDLISHVVDSSRCVDCFDCLPVCPNDAIHYTWERHQLSIPLMRKTGNPLTDPAAGIDAPGPTGMMLDRRAFLSAGLVMAVSPIAAAAKKKRKTLRGGIKAGQMQVSPVVAVTPPGIQDRKDFLDRCTGCGLCISHCMTKVLRPSITEYGVLRLFHPVKDYDEAYCAYTCTRCTDLCPTGALRPITREEKISMSVGLAQVSYDYCIACGKCARSCPAEAIDMTEFANRENRRFPVVDPAKCIGCGACQYVCPAPERKAIIVNGLS